MKPITNLAAALLLLTTSGTNAATSVDIYDAPLGEVAISSSENEGKYFLIAISGGHPSDAATAGNCTITATITKKEGQFTGWLTPLKISDFSYNEAMAKDKAIRLLRKNNDILIEDADTLGICGFGVDFVEIYYKLQTNSEKYKLNYKSFLKIAYEIAKDEYTKGNKIKALATLGPYAENYPTAWLAEKNTDPTSVIYLNDYAFFLQQTGHSLEAINILERILGINPTRAVAWLNLADAYWDIKEYSSAQDSYRKYQILMSNQKKADRVPKRVIERIGTQ